MDIFSSISDIFCLFCTLDLVDILAVLLLVLILNYKNFKSFFFLSVLLQYWQQFGSSSGNCLKIRGKLESFFLRYCYMVGCRCYILASPWLHGNECMWFCCWFKKNRKNWKLEKRQQCMKMFLELKNIFICGNKEKTHIHNLGKKILKFLFTI